MALQCAEMRTLTGVSVAELVVPGPTASHKNQNWMYCKISWDLVGHLEWYRFFERKRIISNWQLNSFLENISTCFCRICDCWWSNTSIYRHSDDQVRSRLREDLCADAGIKGKRKQLHLTCYVGCNYLPLPLIPASGTQVLICGATGT